MKRKLDPEETSEETRDSSKEFGKLNRAKNVSKLSLRVVKINFFSFLILLILISDCNFHGEKSRILS